jgi:ATP-grasp domain
VQHGKQLKVLLAASNWWPASARMALALIEHGCAVAAICPPGHPLRYVAGIERIDTLRGFASTRSLEAAIHRAQPDAVVPCDDRCVMQLHELHQDRPELRALIEHSLGDPRGFAVVESRGKLLEAARQLGIRVARAHTVTSAAHARDCYLLGGCAALLKMDGTGGGEGVQVVRSGREAAVAFRRMQARLGMTTALKRLVIDRDPLALWCRSRRKQAAVTIQEFVAGIPANIMVACCEGRILAEASVQAVSCQGPTGAALVVQLIDNHEFSRAAALLAAHLGMSGFFGLDFMLEHGSGAAYLVEMNPRCTQLGHLPLRQGDLAGAWCASLAGSEALKARQPIESNKIAFFPQAWLWGAKSAMAADVHHDVPWEQKQLIEILSREPWPQRQWLARIYHMFRRPAAAEAVEMTAGGLISERSFDHSLPRRGSWPES